MSSPNDPGESGANERPVDQADLPPWQRAERRRGSHAAATGPQRIPDREPRPGGAPTEIIPIVDDASAPPTAPTSAPRSSGRPSAGLDARLSRFISGTAAPAGFTTPPTRAETDPEPEPYDEVPEKSERADRPEPPRAGTPWGESSAQEPVRAPKSALKNEDLPDLSGPVPRSPRRSDAAQGGSAVTVGPSRRGPLRAAMQIRRIDPWATLKVSLVLSVVFFFVWMIAVAMLYLVLGAMGVWSKLNENVGELITNSGGGELVSSGTIFGTALLIGLVNIVLMTAAATIGAFIYNLTTDLVGGVEITLADRD
ncbi:DUF3566 domain-containing protein [Mycobacteroides abscessus]|uniref:Integral membrane protein n=1 Tax=Mycobacteroides abscessus subsp. bolletii TaxID=319705 RepID=A0A9Q7WL35_9MYCO|nr:DUF3566 domain-containing protein [Mycobacteroides abscessus]AMU19414.1 hypothetical protein A3N95_00100 [Mycobacteroides abscessus]MBN7457619.1 DUF3566 domain-containing protein [Mycobacteroides abscessus subsp. abscessus]MBN7546377.1 DUF3566 domain-containing protein [Mycobacteroides abscessus subsp. abscessus]MBN7570301.1 DUF3566 domain-containing protein [Mycobacteroides abscessus subsp. abscessus]MDO2969771.1 DUF3566 domain-containing protein [Mycobacteroides abscessus subsp. bolletii]